MEKTVITGKLYKITVEDRARKDGNGTVATGNARIIVTSRVRNQQGVYENRKTFYNANAVGYDADQWRKFKDGDWVSLSGLPTYDPYISTKDGTLQVGIRLDEVHDMQWDGGGGNLTQQDGQAQQPNGRGTYPTAQAAPVEVSAAEADAF